MRLVSDIVGLREVVLGVVGSGALFPVGIGVVNGEGVVVRELVYQFPRLVNPVNGKSVVFMPGMEEVVLEAIA